MTVKCCLYYRCFRKTSDAKKHEVVKLGYYVMRKFRNYGQDSEIWGAKVDWTCS